MDAPEDKMSANSEPETSVKTHFFVKINARENSFTFYSFWKSLARDICDTDNNSDNLNLNSWKSMFPGN